MYLQKDRYISTLNMCLRHSYTYTNKSDMVTICSRHCSPWCFFVSSTWFLVESKLAGRMREMKALYTSKQFHFFSPSFPSCSDHQETKHSCLPLQFINESHTCAHNGHQVPALRSPQLCVSLMDWEILHEKYLPTKVLAS